MTLDRPRLRFWLTPLALLAILFSVGLAMAACGGAQPPPAAPASIELPPVTPPSSAAAAAPSTSDAPAMVPALSPPPGEAVTLPNGASGWLKGPTSTGRHPAIILVHEWWGMNDWIKQDVARFADKGYVALAVDLYRGRVAADPGEAHELSRGLPEDRALSDLKTGFDWLAARADVDPSRIGVIGWCMGGGYALGFAAVEPRLRSAVVNYGKIITAPEKVAGIHPALLGNYAGADRGIAPADVRAFADALKADHKDADIKVYDGAKHAFMNPNNKEGYDAAASQDAWSRIDAFFARTLK